MTDQTSSSHGDDTGSPNGALDEDHVLDAVLSRAGAVGWSQGSLAQVAEDLEMPAARILSLFPTRAAVLAAWGARIDAQVLADGIDLDPEETVRDRLFDLIMRRLDALAPHKEAAAALAPACAGDPLLGLTAAMGLSRSMGMTLEAAGVGASGFAGLLRVKGLSALFLYVLRIWLADDSPDMAKTMATLDKALDKAESAANSLFPGLAPRQRDSMSHSDETNGPSATEKHYK